MGKQPRTPPFSLRLSFEERQKLEALAGDEALGAYIRSLIFNEEAAPLAKRRRARPVKDNEALLRVLTQLGQSRLANNLNQLAKLANLGALPLTPDVEESLREAARDIAAIRSAVVQALGLDSGPS
ncbi:plasmid mobilization relaxosome protein MobC [Brevundimonas sp.]|uniref:plasmid mobilization relaxosome protein MobC n=1 Tax=Brevundimonas sp. TaxID=1871086 RepID=UPI0022BB2413|nr:plasmid mobilization relaxosome protein MobC [Brevundimonas sp.]MCZ8193846.1 hypothetical protein [Brevundimonas sp.]